MQHRIIYKRITLFQVFSLLMIIPMTALSGGEYHRYSGQQVNGGGNPWAIPGSPESNPGFQQPLEHQSQEWSRQNRAYQTGRFVTPEFLESLRQQQSQYQIMPENRRYLEPDSQHYGPGLPGADSYGYPSYGLDYVDPLYDTPMISPWGIGADSW